MKNYVLRRRWTIESAKAHVARNAAGLKTCSACSYLGIAVPKTARGKKPEKITEGDNDQDKNRVGGLHMEPRHGLL
jgi:hypothetical protein